MVIAAEQLQAGDIVEYGGARHLVAEIRRPCGAAWPMAVDRHGWAIASARNRCSSSVGRSRAVLRSLTNSTTSVRHRSAATYGCRAVAAIGRSGASDSP